MSPCSIPVEFKVEQPSQTSNALPLPGTEAYEALPQFPKSPLPFRRTIRRQELRQIVPLAETTIYEMERRGDFPRRFNLTPRCIVWELAEVEAWIEQRKQAPRRSFSKPDVHLPKNTPNAGGFESGMKPAPALIPPRLAALWTSSAASVGLPLPH